MIVFVGGPQCLIMKLNWAYNYIVDIL